MRRSLPNGGAPIIDPSTGEISEYPFPSLTAPLKTFSKVGDARMSPAAMICPACKAGDAAEGGVELNGVSGACEGWCSSQRWNGRFCGTSKLFKEEFGGVDCRPGEMEKEVISTGDVPKLKATDKGHRHWSGVYSVYPGHQVAHIASAKYVSCMNGCMCKYT